MKNATEPPKRFPYLPAGGRRRSLNPRPDASYGQPSRESFFQEIDRISSTAVATCCKSHALHDQNADLALRNRIRIAAEKRAADQELLSAQSPVCRASRNGVASRVQSLDLLSICGKAIAPIRRAGLPFWIQPDDLIQSVCVKLLTAGIAEEGTAVIAARNLMRDVIRMEKRRREAIKPGPYPLDGPGYKLPSTSFYEAQAALGDGDGFSGRADEWEAVKVLPPRQHQAVMLTFWDGMTDVEAAAQMGISRQAVDELLLKAKINIAEGLAIGHRETFISIGGHDVKNDGEMQMELLTVADLAKLLKVHPNTVRAQAKLGKIPGCRRIGGRMYASKAVLESYFGKVQTAADVHASAAAR